MKPNFIDKTVLFFNPTAGQKRLAARAKADLLMSYDAASRGRRTAGWRAPATDADTAAKGSRERLRQLSRDMIRNRPYAKRAQDVVTLNVVGPGITFSVRDVSNRDAIEKVLKAHFLSSDIDARGECNLFTLQTIVMNAVVSDGEVLLRRRVRRGRYSRGLALPFQVEILEADHLDTNIQEYGSNRVVEGVEYGPTGAIEAYHLWRDHPGSDQPSVSIQSERVPWRDIIHVRRMDRPGQLRGVPWLAPVMLTLGELADYQEAQILKQRFSALVAGVLTSEDGQATTPDNARAWEDLQPGALVMAPPGTTLTMTNPPKVDDYKVFMSEGLGAVAMGVGITREALSGDLSGVNFSSGRMGRMEMDRNVESWQQNIMIRQFCAGIERWAREAWPLQTVQPTAKFALDWTAPRRPLIDPNKEIEAEIKAIEAGIKSRQGVQRQMGEDPDRVREERADDLKDDEAAGLAPVAPPKPTENPEDENP